MRSSLERRKDEAAPEAGKTLVLEIIAPEDCRSFLLVFFLFLPVLFATPVDIQFQE